MAYYDWETIQHFYNDHTKLETLEKFSIKVWSWNSAIKRNVLLVKDEDKLKASKYVKKPIEDYLVNPSYMDSTHLKKRLLTENLLKAECSICKTTDWCGKPLTLHLDHINGVHHDNRLDNLRVLCPNCHSQTDTYCGRNPRYKS